MPRPPSIGVDQAYRTLCNAALFLGSGRPRFSPVTDDDPVRPKVIGNSLRELDRFLSILLDEIAAEAGWSAADLDLLGRIRNTPNKLQSVCRRLDIGFAEGSRLRALGRCRDTLFHCRGTVRRGDTRDARLLTMGWPADGLNGAAAALAMGDRVHVDQADLTWICAFYVRIGGSLVPTI